MNENNLFRQRVKLVYASRHALWQMALKQLKSKYTASAAGVFSALISPLLIMLAISFVFSAVLKTEINNFALFVLSGIFPWLFFSQALTESAGSVLNQQAVMRQYNLPKETLPLSSVLSAFLNFLAGWVIIYPVFLSFKPGIIFLLPLFILALMLILFFTAGLGLFLSALNVIFRDAGQLLGVVLMFWFWITPVFYSVDMIPGKFRWVYDINPAAPFIAIFQSVIYKAEAPSLYILISASLLAFISVMFGFWFFSKFENRLLKLI